MCQCSISNRYQLCYDPFDNIFSASLLCVQSQRIEKGILVFEGSHDSTAKLCSDIFPLKLQFKWRTGWRSLFYWIKYLYLFIYFFIYWICDEIKFAFGWKKKVQLSIQQPWAHEHVNIKVMIQRVKLNSWQKPIHSVSSLVFLFVRFGKMQCVTQALWFVVCGRVLQLRRPKRSC